MISGEETEKAYLFSHDFTSFSLFLPTFPYLFAATENLRVVQLKFSVVNKNKNSNKFTA